MLLDFFFERVVYAGASLAAELTSSVIAAKSHGSLPYVSLVDLHSVYIIACSLVVTRRLYVIIVGFCATTRLGST